MIADHRERKLALDPTQSFIVQAPAGSGKTSLLTQRFLTLLAHVKRAPEEVVAITFTRKAAHEMRNRVIDALQSTNASAPKDEHHKNTYDLASAVMQRDKEMGWQLLGNPHRLRIQTIDSLAYTLVQRSPVMSKFGHAPTIIDDARPLYDEAAEALLRTLGDNTAWNEALTILLLHLDNHYDRVRQLLASMLSQREQWLTYVLAGYPRIRLENYLQHYLTDQLNAVSFTDDEKSALLPLLRFAGLLSDTDEFPAIAMGQIETWKSICNLLLTQKGEWRKQVNAKNGFPATHKAEKQAMTELLESFWSRDELREQLSNVMCLPNFRYSENQWTVLESLITLLPVLVAQLHLIFQKNAAVDFSAITHAALEALGDETTPTELALNLDYQIQHLLVDEFQDTSLVQCELLKRLVAGWQINDGRTLFFVGDPMQSIYRFRQAEVGSFLIAQNNGFAGLPLTPLTLSSNFRSQAGLIDWFNQHFPNIFPRENTPELGAISYSPSTATADRTAENAFEFRFSCDEYDEANTLVNIIQQTPENHSIAILVRARTHLTEILPALQAANISFSAVELDTLYDRTICQDLLALTRALLFPADKIAWLSILRAPWCGLLLADLFKLTNDAHLAPLLVRLQDNDWLESNLSKDGVKRVQHFMSAILPAVYYRQGKPLHTMIRELWQALGGPACVQDESEFIIADTYFELLAKHETSGRIKNLSAFIDALYNAKITPIMTEKPRVQIMTIHKAKGLEFDTVIVPGSHRSGAQDASSLLMTAEIPRARQNELLIAPIKSSETDRCLMYDMIKRINKQKQTHELTRLLYVALTRAKQRCFVLGNAKLKKRDSFLSLLWSSVKDQIVDTETNSDTEQLLTRSPLLLNRLTSEWLSRHSTTDIVHPVPQNEPIVFRWDSKLDAKFGTAAHRILEGIGNLGFKHWFESTENREEYLLKCLRIAGIPKSEIYLALNKLKLLIEKVRDDKFADWVFKESHTDALNEYVIGDYVIDRTFVDHCQVRWIIDYKCNEPRKDESKQMFITRMEDLYRSQLRHYAKALSKLSSQPIKTALYFPLVGVLVEVDVRRDISRLSAP